MTFYDMHIWKQSPVLLRLHQYVKRSKEADFMIKERHSLKDFDPFDFQFCPFNAIYEQPKCDLILFVDNDNPVSEEFMAAAWDVVYNLLGERITALNIGNITIFPIEDAPEEIQIALLPITELPNWFEDNSSGGFIVDAQGIITPR